jgi:hypothetical protein
MKQVSWPPDPQLARSAIVLDIVALIAILGALLAWAFVA